MTDKNIIDEVNVSRCKYFNNGWCLLSESCDVIKYKSCGDMTLADCYYRNWQRKEQECEELTSQRDKFEFGNNILEHERNNYKQALDEIEKQVKAMNNECFYDDICDCNNCDMKNGCSYYRKFKILDIINSVKDKNVPHKAKDGE